MGINVRNKGKQGESEFVNRFQMFFPNEIKRNLLQTREGGADISGCAPFQIEVKRCQKLDRKMWWRQVQAACLSEDDIPVVAYRQNHCPWMFLIPANLLPMTNDPGYMEVEEKVFLTILLGVYENTDSEESGGAETGP